MNTPPLVCRACAGGWAEKVGFAFKMGVYIRGSIAMTSPFHAAESESRAVGTET